MKIRKASYAARGISLLMACMLLLSLGACGGKKPAVESSGSTTESATDTSGTSGSSTTSDSTATTSDGTATTGDGSTTGESGTSGNTPGSSTSSSTNTTNPPASGDFVIVDNKKAVATIVISKNASDKVIAAATDLQDYIKRMTGATVKVGYDDVDRTNGNYILVGPSKYTDKLGIKQPKGYPGNEKVILKRVNNYLVLMGNDDGPYLGTQYAVTMFLEEQGCGWFGTSDLWQVVPAKSTISVSKLDVTHTPKFTSRQNNVWGNYRLLGQRWYLGGEENTYGHYLPNLVPKDTFSTHPEWFSEINGKRNCSATWWQYCYSNKAFAREVGKKVSAYFDSNPNTVTYSITANDGWETDWCECSECSKYPTDTDLMLTFANRVGEEVAKKHPDKKVAILSYHSTWFAPQTSVKAASNVEVMFCTETSMTSPIEDGLYLGDTRNPITHNTYKTSWKANFQSYIKKANLKNISIWKWLCVAADTSGAVWKDIPWVQGDVAIQDQNFWKENGASYVYYDQGPLAAYRETEASFPLRWPLWYVAAKGMWDASLSGDDILKDACNKLYGKGADAMYGYYKALADASEACTGDSITWIPPEPSEMYTRSQVSKIDAAIAKANAQLKNVTAVEKERMQNQIKLWNTAKTKLY